MSLFRRRAQRELVLDRPAYGRWLRAQRPPLEWFLSLASDEQEALAVIGDEYLQDLSVALGYAVRDPEVTAAGMDAARNPESEEVLARRLAAGLVERSLERRDEEAPSMGGFGARRRVLINSRQSAAAKVQRFLGRAPDATS